MSDSRQHIIFTRTEGRDANGEGMISHGAFTSSHSLHYPACIQRRCYKRREALLDVMESPPTSSITMSMHLALKFAN